MSGPYQPFDCKICGEHFERSWRQKLCEECARAVRRLRAEFYGDAQQDAMTEVAKAIRHGKLKPATRFRCTDCSKRAECYDHRSYERPLDVEPVCRSCNLKRGHTDDLPEYLRVDRRGTPTTYVPPPELKRAVLEYRGRYPSFCPPPPQVTAQVAT